MNRASFAEKVSYSLGFANRTKLAEQMSGPLTSDQISHPKPVIANLIRNGIVHEGRLNRFISKSGRSRKTVDIASLPSSVFSLTVRPTDIENCAYTNTLDKTGLFNGYQPHEIIVPGSVWSNALPELSRKFIYGAVRNRFLLEGFGFIKNFGVLIAADLLAKVLVTRFLPITTVVDGNILKYQAEHPHIIRLLGDTLGIINDLHYDHNLYTAPLALIAMLTFSSFISVGSKSQYRTFIFLKFAGEFAAAALSIRTIDHFYFKDAVVDWLLIGSNAAIDFGDICRGIGLISLCLFAIPAALRYMVDITKK